MKLRYVFLQKKFGILLRNAVAAAVGARLVARLRAAGAGWEGLLRNPRRQALGNKGEYFEDLLLVGLLWWEHPKESDRKIGRAHV